MVPVGFGIWSTPIYWENTATPLTRDLDDERKICLVGEIIEIKYAGSDPARGMKIVLKTPYKADLEEFASSARVVADALVVGSQVALEYTPHARFILWLALRVPLTLEERQQHQTEENTSLAGALLAVSSIVALLLLGMGWWLDLFVPFALITGLILALVVGIRWLVRR